MSIERRMHALIDIVEADRRERVAAILRDAEEAAAALLRDAHRQARLRVRAAFAEERRLRDERVHAARANLQTKQRLTSQQRAAVMLARAWQALPDALQARWRDADSRRRWIAHVVAQARPVLVRGRWVVELPAEALDDDRAHVRELAADPDVEIEFRSNAAIRAGLKIGGLGTVVDGTLDELLRDRSANAARLLAYVEPEEARP